MNDDVFNHLLYQVGNAQVRYFPYPHFFIENLFPQDYYDQLIESIPNAQDYYSMGSTGKVDPRTYQERSVLQITDSDLSGLPFHQMLFWSQFGQALESSVWRQMLISKFQDLIEKRFKDHLKEIEFSSFAELVQDRTHYALGPHTDHPIRVLTMLFYFPKDHSQSEMGTSVYRPNDINFKCEGFKHHPKDGFSHLYKAPYIPNSLFGFFKSDRSFHGVEEITQNGCERNLLNYYLQWSTQC
ncbi:MAG: hypothetical protein P0S95_00525 [Rhabdochlamydiaceae bacterium]|nr:hypothetical protein [Candidatus Amphrikana amoebophyrae]